MLAVEAVFPVAASLVNSSEKFESATVITEYKDLSWQNRVAAHDAKIELDGYEDSLADVIVQENELQWIQMVWQNRIFVNSRNSGQLRASLISRLSMMLCLMKQETSHGCYNNFCSLWH